MPKVRSFEDFRKWNRLVSKPIFIFYLLIYLCIYLFIYLFIYIFINFYLATPRPTFFELQTT